MRPEVAITGVGAVTPLGVGAEVSFEAWKRERCGIADGVAACEEFKPEQFLSVKEIRRTDRFTQLAICAADEALAMAGWEGRAGADGLPFAPHRIGCVIGTGTGGIDTLTAQQDRYREQGPASVWPLTIPVLMGNAAAGTLAMRYGLQGYSSAVISACASGADAIAAGCRLIRGGELDAVVVGGSEAALNPLVLSALETMGALSRLGVSRPFDARRDGFVMGEGAGVLVLERFPRESAGAAVPLARLAGIGASSDAFHLTAPEPGGVAAARAIEIALSDAGRAASEVGYVNAHGTSTPLNDRSETKALKLALGAHAAEVPISSFKSAIGHLLGAAGAVEAVATVLTLRDEIAPPTLGYEEPEEGLDLDYVSAGPQPLGEGRGSPLLALSNSFGFGGHNVVLAFESPAGEWALG
ncbi:MAG TPA: beta-ketoacyl-ACP synthase II [Solirubrobacterales bacterium]|nr:beta-ketoacyl-ACP synthase II [Solirubrobacterales bacterium]